MSDSIKFNEPNKSIVLDKVIELKNKKKEYEMEKDKFYTEASILRDKGSAIYHKIREIDDVMDRVKYRNLLIKFISNSIGVLKEMEYTKVNKDIIDKLELIQNRILNYTYEDKICDRFILDISMFFSGTRHINKLWRMYDKDPFENFTARNELGSLLLVNKGL